MRLFLTILNLALISSSCLKQDVDIDLTATSWKVEKIRLSGQSTLQGADSVYILNFDTDTTLTLSLDVNTCPGKYTIPGKGRIEIFSFGCTEICCDSEYARTLAELLPKMTEYYGSGDELHLLGEGKIVLSCF